MVAKRTQKSKPIRAKIYTSTFRQGSSYLRQVLVRHLHVCQYINRGSYMSAHVLLIL